jgi:hypothetical protein
MAEPPTPQDSAQGCLVLVALLVGLVLALAQPWLLLPLLLLALVGGSLLLHWGTGYRQRLEQLVQRMGKELANSPCGYGNRLGMIEGAMVLGPPLSPQVVIRLVLFDAESQWRQMPLEVVVLPPPRGLSRFTSSRAWEPYLQGAGILLLPELSVEAKATSAAVDCMRQARWSERALERLDALLQPLLQTIENAHGNELLEPSLPQLQRAQAAFKEEERKLQEALAGSLAMLENLREFLTVPEAIRPILNFDLDDLLDPQQFNDVRCSYEEVVVLQESYRQLLEEANG